jgi:hypothetical protein
VHLPLGLIAPIIKQLEKVAYKQLPFTLGQLGTFRNAGTIEENALWLEQRPHLRSLAEMLTAPYPVRISSVTMPVERLALIAEGEFLASYLTGAAPWGYITEKYAQAHERTSNYAMFGKFDELLLRFARKGRLCTSIADAYASLAARRSALRRKLILLTAILESCPPDRGLREQTDSESKLLLSLLLAARGLLFVLNLVLGMILLLPFQIQLGGVKVPSAAKEANVKQQRPKE